MAIFNSYVTNYQRVGLVIHQAFLCDFSPLRDDEPRLPKTLIPLCDVSELEVLEKFIQIYDVAIGQNPGT